MTNSEAWIVAVCITIIVMALFCILWMMVDEYGPFALFVIGLVIGSVTLIAWPIQHFIH